MERMSMIIPVWYETHNQKQFNRIQKKKKQSKQIVKHNKIGKKRETHIATAYKCEEKKFFLSMYL